MAWQPNQSTGFYPGQDPQQGYYGRTAPPGYPTAPPGYPPQSAGYPGPPQQGYAPVIQIHGGGGYPEPQGFPGGQPGYPPPAGFVAPPMGPPMGGMGPPMGGMGPPMGGMGPPMGGMGAAPMGMPYGHVPKPFTPSPSGYGGGFPDDSINAGEGNENFDFSDKSIRRAFIRKVYSILMCQLLVSLGFIALFTYHYPTKRYVQTHRALLWIAFGVMIVSLIAISCCVNVRRKFPMNFIFLSIFTLAESFILGVMSSTYQTDAVLMAVGLTAAICLGLTLFAFQTKWDFTLCGGGLFVAAILLMIFGIVAIFIPGKTVTLIYASLGAMLFSLYLIYDTQMMMGGKHKYSISPEEYIFAALNLYMDIVNIFMYILTIIGASRD